MADYREEILDVSSFPIEESERLVYAFNYKFPKKDAYMFLEGPSLHIKLYQLDMTKYREFLDGLDISTELAEQVYDIIDSIGSYGINGNKRLFSGYNAERKVINRKAKEQSRSKHYYASDHNFSKVNNELPSAYENKIICADSLDFLKKLPDNCIDIIVTSPPYNFGLEYDTHNDTARWNEYFDMLFAIFEECIRVLKYGGRFAVNVQPLYSDYIPIHHIISNFFIQNKMIWKGEILWEKNNYNCKYSSWGSWKSPSSPYLKYTWEFVELYCKGDLKKPGKKENIDITAEEFKSWVVAKWSIAPERNMSEYGHPAMFPEELVERILKLFSYQNDVVLDPFNGAGTTTVVAKKTGRRYLGIDISEEYCRTAQKRIDECDLGQQSLLDKASERT
ncbi:MAG: site-specific DNA-methyltransferase [Tepidanaerobacteraceae bacterium]|nr:site-specific DNA-methyltransferase [Tepidanaerobacter sp.]